MSRTKPFYSKKKIINFINDNKIVVTKNALTTANDCFGWGIEDIKIALKSLKVNHWYDGKGRFNNPKIIVDYYRAYDLRGENVYTHFYFEDEMLIVDSFKEI